MINTVTSFSFAHVQGVKGGGGVDRKKEVYCQTGCFSAEFYVFVARSAETHAEFDVVVVTY